MLTPSNNFFIFNSIIAWVLLFGFSLKIDHYENNQLINMNNGYSKLYIKPDSFKKMKLIKNNWFSYQTEGKLVQNTIQAINTSQEGYEIILNTRNYNQLIIPITYKSGKENLWREVFK